MVVVRAITMRCLQRNIILKADSIPEIQNALTDSLSRLQMTRFREIGPRDRSRTRACSISGTSSDRSWATCNCQSVNEHSTGICNCYGNFTAVRSNYSFSMQWPVPENQIHLYITYPFHNGYVPTTAALHVSAISFKHKICNTPDTTATFLVSKMLEGFRRIRSNPDTCRSVMYDNLLSICIAFQTMKWGCSRLHTLRHLLAYFE